MEMNCTFLLLLFWSFPKYQSINKHEKQLVIHKAFGNFVVIRANWSGSTNAGDGNSSVVWTNLNEWKILNPKDEANDAVQLAAACHLHAESDRNITNFWHKVNYFNHL